MPPASRPQPGLLGGIQALLVRLVDAPQQLLVLVPFHDLVEKIGALSAARMRLVLDGLYLLFEPGDPE